MDDTLVAEYLDYFTTLPRADVRYIVTDRKLLSDYPDIIKGLDVFIPKNKIIPMLHNISENPDYEDQTTFLVKYLITLCEEYIEDPKECAKMLGLKDDADVDEQFLEQLNKIPH